MTRMLDTREKNYRKDIEGLLGGQKGPPVISTYPKPYVSINTQRDQKQKHFKPSPGCQLATFNR